MSQDKVMMIIYQSNPKKEDLEWLREYRNCKLRFIEVQGRLLNTYILNKMLDIIDLIDFKLHFHSLEKMN